MQARHVGNKLGWAGMAALCLLGLAMGRVQSAESQAGKPAAKAADSAAGKVPAKAGKDASGKADAASKTKETMNLAELRDMQSFAFIAGGRDPFHFRRVDVLPSPEAAQAGTTAKTMEVPTKVIAQEDTEISAEDKETLLRKACGEAQARFKEGDFRKSSETCQKALAVSGKWKKDKGDRILAMERQLFNLHDTALRMAVKEDIQKEFESLSIVVTVTRRGRDGTAAVVNNQIVEPGQILDLSPKGQVMIDSIDDDGVIFNYKGQKLRKSNDAESSGAAAPAAGKGKKAKP